MNHEIESLRQQIEKLEETEKYLNQVIDRISDPVFVKDREHKVILANDAFCSMAGKKREEIIGSSTMPDEVAASLWAHEEMLFEKGNESLSEDILNDAAGVAHIFMAKKSILMDARGNKLIVGVLRDSTEYKRLETQFLQAQKMEAVGLLAGGVAHDFNNLLNVINGYSELLIEDLPDGDPSRKDLELIRDAGKRAAILTSQLLAFGRKQVLQPEILDMNGIISNMMSMLRRLLGEDIELSFVADPGLAMANVDPGKIQQIIMNLVSNARDAMLQGGKLTIETSNVEIDINYLKKHPMAKPGAYVMVAISDNGIGMDEGVTERVFEPFFTTKEKGKGTGLGLSTVYGIVKQSNGFVWVYSEPGIGTTFKVYFPAALTGQPAAQYQKSAAKMDSKPTETILVVEDEAPVRGLACRILKDRGYNVLEAADGLEALRIAQEYPSEISLVLTDVIMPGISGSTLVVRLQAARPGVKALFISGYTGNAIVDHGILDSKYAFLQKPFTIDGLIRKVRSVLNS